MAGIIDKLESFKNIFNWTVPSKTFPLYALLVATWLATILIPGRYLILMGLLFFLSLLTVSSWNL